MFPPVLMDMVFPISSPSARFTVPKIVTSSARVSMVTVPSVTVVLSPITFPETVRVVLS